MERMSFRALAALLLLALPAWGQPADLVLRGGAVYTVDAARSWAQAVAVREGRIVYVGPDAGLAPFLGPQTRVLALAGKMVLPGFCDAHTHPLTGGVEMSQCRLYDATTQAQLERLIGDYARRHPEKPWVVGQGWATPIFAQGNPRREVLDRLVPDRPAAFWSADGHSIWANSRALKLADLHPVQGGRIERDAAGRPSGTLRENATQLMEARMPPVTAQERREGLPKALKIMARYGITLLGEANAHPEDLETYHELEGAGHLTARVVAAQYFDPEHPDWEGLVERRSRFTGPRLWAPAVKLFADGVMESRTAALLNGEGQILVPHLREVCERLHQLGFQIHVHAIGDRAVRATLDALENAQKRHGKKDLRHQIAHLQLISPPDRQRFRALGVVANFQPFWCVRDSYVAMTERWLGRPTMYPLRSLFASGAVVAAGSDWTVSSCNPLDAIQVGMTRQSFAGGERPWQPEERAELAQLLAAYTINGAWTEHLEKETGSLEVGKSADLVVLDHNLFAVPPQQIHKTRVLLTLLAGEAVYDDLRGHP